MADILIKGMDMPIDGDYLFSFASDEKETICRIEKVSRDGSGTPIQYRMVVEIPTHGRLIDESVFVDNVIKYSHQSTKSIGEALKATPTVIEANEDGEQDGKL